MGILTLLIAGFFGLVCLSVGIVMLCEKDNPIIPLIIFGICFVSCFLTINHLNHLSDKKIWEEVWKTNIVALKDNSNIEGKINGGVFITSGYINESMYYYCMENTTDGKHMITIPSTNTYIIETNDIKPSVIKKMEKYVDERYDFWIPSKNAEKYIIYVPNGTVDTTYKIDLEK